MDFFTSPATDKEIDDTLAAAEISLSALTERQKAILRQTAKQAGSRGRRAQRVIRQES